MSLTITVGSGLTRPQGRRVVLPAGPAVAMYADAYRNLPPTAESWVSPCVWRDDYRLAKQWESGSAVSVDIDYEDKSNPPPEVSEALAQAARDGRLPGSAFHLTPHGARLLFIFGEDCADAELYVRASFGAGALAAQALDDVGAHGYKVDEPILKDLGRLFYAPNAFAKGIQRRADVLEMSATPYAPVDLAAHAPRPVEQPKAQPAPPRQGPSVAELIGEWNAEHPADWPRAGGDCPACGHRGCFGRMPDDDSRWVCWSTDHREPGVRGVNCFHGDAMDLEAFARRCKPVDVLRADGLLSAGGNQTVSRTDANPLSVTPLDAIRRPLRNNSYLTAVTIIGDNLRDVLGGRRLELNAMTGRAELARGPLRDEDVYAVRAEIERRFSGGVDKNGNEVGLKVSQADVFAAVQQIASAQPYHPVREYLAGLTWDGVDRLDHVVEDLFGGERTPLNQAMVRRWFISAIARAHKPGCKVDTVLILVGEQGARKSGFFGLIAGDWHIDTAVDVQDKDSFQVLRRAWVYEWAELEVLRRARDAEAVKSFLSSRIDTYRPSYGRFVVDVPRGCVIVGTTNRDEFLADETGNRRFWPVRTGRKIDPDQVIAQRDQLWAEALTRYHRGEEWWLTDEESALLNVAQQQFTVTDAWDGPVLGYADRQAIEFTTADVLEHALGKPRGQWNRGDEMRVAAVLKRGGWKSGKKPIGKGRPWVR